MRDGLVQQRLVFHDPARLNAAGGRQDRLRLGVVDARCQLMRREAAEDHRVDRAEPRAGEHGDGSLRDHRHIDDNAVALFDAQIAQHRGEQRHLVPQFAIGIAPLHAGHRAVVNECRLVAARRHMPVEAVVAGVALRADEPPPIDAHLGIEDLFCGLVPVDLRCCVGPEARRVIQPFLIEIVIAAHWFSLPGSAGVIDC